MKGPPSVKYPRQIHIGVPPQAFSTLVFVERHGVRIDNLGPFRVRDARRLRRFLDRYLLVETLRAQVVRRAARAR